MSIRVIDRASSRLQLASRRLAASAHNSANALTDGFRRVDVTGAEAAAGGVTTGWMREAGTLTEPRVPGGTVMLRSNRSTTALRSVNSRTLPRVVAPLRGRKVTRSPMASPSWEPRSITMRAGADSETARSSTWMSSSSWGAAWPTLAQARPMSISSSQRIT